MSASAETPVRLKIGSATTGYYYGVGMANAGAGTFNSWSGNNLTLIDRLTYIYTTTGAVTIELQNPFLSVKTCYQWNSGAIQTGAGAYYGGGAGFVSDNTSHTEFTISASEGNLTGTCNVYGYSLS